MATTPKHCLLCRSERVIVEEAGGKYVIACRECGVILAYLPHPPDAPELAGRIEMLLEPFTKPPLHSVRRETARMVKKPTRPKREDAAPSALRVLQPVIEVIHPTYSEARPLEAPDSPADQASLFLLVLATALVTSLPAARAQTRSDQDVTEIRRLEQVWDTAHLQGDVDALDRLWAQDLEVAVPRMPLMSKSDSLRFVCTGRMTFQQYQSSDIHIRIYGTAGVVTGRLVRQRTIAGNQQLDRWRYTKVYVKQDTTWRVVAFHASEAAE